MADQPSSSRPMRVAKQGAIEQMSTLANNGFLIVHSPRSALQTPGFDNKTAEGGETEPQRNIATDPSFQGPSARAKKRKSSESEYDAKRERLSVPAKLKARKQDVIEDLIEDEATLFSLIKNGRAALQQIANDWIAHYEKERLAATVELAQFFVSASGCKGRVSPSLVHARDYTRLIRQMTEDFDEESGDYPLISSGTQWKRFRQNFGDFVQVLIKQCQYNIIYDQYLMDHVLSFLTGLSDSQVRAFRHTSTLAALKITTALVSIAARLKQNLDSLKRQFDAERLKAKRVAERLDALSKKRQECTENNEEVLNMVTYMFRSVFIHRYRDVVPEIRCMCIGELGIWMKSFPSHFMDDSHLKYVSEVRLRCLKTLLPLYEDIRFTNRLELFTNKFKDRIVSMARDVDAEVGVLAIKLVNLVHRYFPTLLTEANARNIFDFVYAAHRGLATTAGDFFMAYLFPYDFARPENRSSPTRSSMERDNGEVLRGLVQFAIDNEMNENPAYLVDALFDCSSAIKDWQTMTNLLLNDQADTDQPMSSVQEVKLIEIMNCSVRQAATGDCPCLTHKEQRQISEDKAKLTEHFIVALPLLLQKYIGSSEAILNLLQIALHFDLEVYSAIRFDKHLDSLLKCIDDNFEKHTDPEILLTCSKLYEYLCADARSIQARCVTERSKLIDTVVVKLRQNVLRFTDELEDFDEDDLASIITSLKKIEALYSCSDLSKYNLLDCLLPFVTGSDGTTRAPHPDVVAISLRCCFHSILWDLHAAEDAPLSEEQMKKLKSKFEQILGICRPWLSANKRSIAETAFLCLTDVLLLFGLAANDYMSEMRSAVQEAVDGVEESLMAFVRRTVFITSAEAGYLQPQANEEEAMEKLHLNRKVLAALCKMTIYGVVSYNSAAFILQHYAAFYNDYGDLMKQILAKYRECNKRACGKAMLLALTNTFKEIQSTSPDKQIDKSSDGFVNLRELAKRLALSLGPDAIRSRETVANIHKDGIDFALCVSETASATKPPENLLFFDILTEFTHKLVKQDKRTLLFYLEKHVSQNDVKDNHEWQSFVLYRNSLTHGEDFSSVQRLPLPISETPAPSVHSPPPQDSFSTMIPKLTSTTIREMGPPPMQPPPAPDTPIFFNV